MRRKCFVVMPFSNTESCTQAEWTEVFNDIIKPAVAGSRLSFECTRSQIRTGAFIKDILDELNNAAVVIADLTDRNANVFYELGVRHALQNRTILISQDMKHVPSDLQPYGVITYSRTPGGMSQFKRDLSGVLRDVYSNPKRPDNPVADFLKTREHVLFQYEHVQALRKLAALITELSRNLSNRRLTFDRLTKMIGGDTTIKFGSALSFHTTALSLLVGTNYVVLPDEQMINANMLLHFLSTINNQLDLWRQGINDKSVLNPLKGNLERSEERLIKLLKAAKAEADRMVTFDQADARLAHHHLADSSHEHLFDKPTGST